MTTDDWNVIGVIAAIACVLLIIKIASRSASNRRVDELGRRQQERLGSIGRDMADIYGSKKRR